MDKDRTQPRCIGHCCRRFSVGDGESYQQIQDEYQEWLNTPGRDLEDEIAIIAPMLIPLGQNSRGKPIFSCHNLSPQGNCSIYETRPQMCREVGESIPCHHPRCRMRPRSLPVRALLFLTEKRL